MSRTTFIAVLLIVGMFWIQPASAGVETPHLLPLQGYATDSAGVPLARADLTVRIYATPSGGVPAYDSGMEFTGAVRSGFVDLALGAGAPLVLDNTQLYFMEVDLDGVEMIGETSGGRWAFYPGTGSHDRSDLEARLDALEALIGPLKKSSATADAPTAAAKFRATGATARLEYGMLGVGKVAGVGSTAQASGNLLLQPVGVFTTGDRILELGPMRVPPPEQITGVDEPVSPARTRLLGCYPNPFNPQTTIRFELHEASVVGVRIYDLAGRRVRTLADDERFDAGAHEIVWNGRDDAGRGVASGTYFYRFEAGEVVSTRSMTLVK